MLDLVQIEKLQRRKKYTFIGVIVISLALVLACIFRFVPRVNDFLAGCPRYTQALTKLMAEEFGRAGQGRFPVLLSGENDHCDPVPSAQIANDQIAGVLYVLTYSERQHFSCVTSYAVPADPSKFTGLEPLRPEAQQLAGPAIPRALKVLPVARNLHVYPTAYLEALHWRVKPHFPISETQAAGLAAQHYESRNPAVPVDERAGIDIDFEKARDLVRQPYDKANAWLMRIISALAFCEFCLALSLSQPYRNVSRHLFSYGERFTVWNFLIQNLGKRASAARLRYYERERAQQEQERRMAQELMLREDLEERLRLALVNLQDGPLRLRIQEYLSGSPDLELMKQLSAEAQKTAGFKSPEQKIASLLESLEPLCTEEELNSCRFEAARILADSGFKNARYYVVSMHDQFKTQLREIEASEASSEADEDSARN